MSGKAGYAEIATYFRQQIADGTLAPGDRMPTQKQVTQQFGASVATVNRAFKMLKEEGLTVARPGSFTVVSDRPRVASTGAARLKRLSRTGRPYGPRESSIKHDSGIRSCTDPDVASSLGIELHDEVVFRSRVFTRGGIPTIAAFSAINMRAIVDVPELLDEGPLPRFWQEIYTERTGRVITKSPEMQGARFASTNEMELLEVDAPPEAVVPVLILVNVFYDEDGPIEFWEDVYRPGLWRSDEE